MGTRRRDLRILATTIGLSLAGCRSPEVDSAIDSDLATRFVAEEPRTLSIRPAREISHESLARSDRGYGLDLDSHEVDVRDFDSRAPGLVFDGASEALRAGSGIRFDFEELAGVGPSVGVGVDLPLNDRVTLGLDARVVMVTGDSARDLGVPAFGISAGVRF